MNRRKAEEKEQNKLIAQQAAIDATKNMNNAERMRLAAKGAKRQEQLRVQRERDEDNRRKAEEKNDKITRAQEAAIEATQNMNNAERQRLADKEARRQEQLQIQRCDARAQAHTYTHIVTVACCVAPSQRVRCL